MKKPKNIGKVIAVILLMILSALLFFAYQYGPYFNIYLFPPSPQKYGDYALEMMDRNGIYSNTSTWQEAKAQAKREIAGAKTYEEALVVLEKVIKVAGGKHSFISSVELSSDGEPSALPTVEVDQNILILHLPMFLETDEKAQEYANILAEAINEAEYEGIIIDLAHNQGGNMKPMIVGLSQLLPDGELFSFVYRNGTESPVLLQHGTINEGGGNVMLQTEAEKIEVPIAIITGEQTGSSGEMTLLAFIGLDHVKTFGQDTAGYATVNYTFPMYDGTLIQITCGTVKSRTGERFGEEPIKPDEYTENPYEDAISWIKAKK